MLPLNPQDFSKTLPLFQTSWSANSLATFKTCPRKYFYEKICGWRAKRSSFHLEFGGHYADAIELYHLKRATGTPHDEATCAVVRSALCHGERSDDGVFHPWATDDPNKNRFTLIRAIVWYLEKFKDDAAKTVILDNGKPAVELQFRFGVGEQTPGGHDVDLHGYIDRLVQFGDDIYVADNKTTKSTISDHYFKQFNPNCQMSLYTLAGMVAFKLPTKGVIIDAVQLAVGFARFTRAFTTRTVRQLEEWLDDAQRFINQAERYATEAEDWPGEEVNCYPMNDTACDKYGGCPFRGICSASPDVRHLYLSSDFEQKIYTPKKPREV